MKEVFADTGYWIASVDPRDALHRRTLEFWHAPLWTRIVTSEWVLVEFLNYYAELGAHPRTAALNLVMTLRTDPAALIISQSMELFTDALRLYQQRPDKAWSLTDCSSFLIMQERGIGVALTADHHFEQAGFQALLRS